MCLQASQDSGPVFMSAMPTGFLRRGHETQEAGAGCTAAATLLGSQVQLPAASDSGRSSALKQATPAFFFPRRRLKKSIDLNEKFRGQKNSTT